VIYVITNCRRQARIRLGHVVQRFGIKSGFAVVPGAKRVDDGRIRLEMAGEGYRVGEGAEVVAPGQNTGRNECGGKERAWFPLLFEIVESGIEITKEPQRD